jgi:hypothetical protein
MASRGKPDVPASVVVLGGAGDMGAMLCRQLARFVRALAEL